MSADDLTDEELRAPGLLSVIGDLFQRRIVLAAEPS